MNAGNNGVLPDRDAWPLQRIAVFLRSPLIASSQGYLTRDTFLLMIPEVINQGVDVDLISPVIPIADYATPDDLQPVDPRIQVLPLAGFRSGWEMYVSRVPKIAASIARTIRRHRDRWDLIWMIDFDIYSQLIEIVARVSHIRTVLYLRARYDLMLHWQRTTGIRAPAAALMRMWTQLAIPRMTHRVPTVVNAESLRLALAPRVERLHVFTATLVRDRDLREPHRVRMRDQSPTLLVVGRVQWAKGLAVLVEALSKLGEAHPVHLRVVGPETPGHIVELTQLAKQLGVDASITFVGPVPFGPCLWQEYAGADLFVHPSLSEGRPKAVVEAMAAGLPIVASRVGGIPELVTDGEDGLLVQAGDPAELADALRRLLTNRPLAQKLGERARQRAGSLTLESQVGQLLSFLSEPLHPRFSDGDSVTP